MNCDIKCSISWKEVNGWPQSAALKGIHIREQEADTVYTVCPWVKVN